MTYVRGQERFVTEEVIERVREGLLVGQGWGAAPGSLPWGATVPLTFIEAPPDPLVAAKTGVLAPNSVAISEGRVPPDDELEIGGTLVETVNTYFIDVYGENRGIAKCIALDVRALLTDRVPGYRSVLQLRNWADDAKPVLPGHLLRIEDVELDHPAVSMPTKLHWYVVKATVTHEHQGGY